MADDSDIPPWVSSRDIPVDSQRTQQSAGDQFYPVEGIAVRETEKAILFEVYLVNGCDPEPTNRKQWFPLSQVKSITYNHVNSPEDPDAELQYDKMMVKQWLLKNKDLL